jgi:hypothetical protein
MHHHHGKGKGFGKGHHDHHEWEHHEGFGKGKGGKGKGVGCFLARLFRGEGRCDGEAVSERLALVEAKLKREGLPDWKRARLERKQALLTEHLTEHFASKAGKVKAGMEAVTSETAAEPPLPEATKVVHHGAKSDDEWDKVDECVVEGVEGGAAESSFFVEVLEVPGKGCGFGKGKGHHDHGKGNGKGRHGHHDHGKGKDGKGKGVGKGPGKRGRFSPIMD